MRANEIVDLGVGQRNKIFRRGHKCNKTTTTKYEFSTIQLNWLKLSQTSGPKYFCLNQRIHFFQSKIYLFRLQNVFLTIENLFGWRANEKGVKGEIDPSETFPNKNDLPCQEINGPAEKWV